MSLPSLGTLPLDTPFPGPALINPDPYYPILERLRRLTRNTAPATFLSGLHVAPSSARSRPILIIDHLANTVFNDASGKKTNYRHLIRVPEQDIWICGMINYLGRLAQGVGD